MFSLTLCSAESTIPRAMNAALPETVDAWRMVQARRSFQGSIPLAALSRLRGSLASAEGAVTYDIEFGKNELGVANVWVRAEAGLPLTCQRSLEPFVLPVQVDARLGLIESEAEESGLPAGFEPLLVDNGQLRLADVVEDELILALPVVPLKPGVAPVERVWGDNDTETSATGSDNPFAVLRKMKVPKK